MSDERYVDTDEAEDVAGSIRHALRCADFVSEDPQAWKWGILALHSALQGALVCHLTTYASPLGAVRDPEKWVHYFEQPRQNKNLKPPKTRIMNLPELLESAGRLGSCGGFSDCKKIEISDAEFAWLKRIHTEIRNDFVHFAPKGWSIEVSGVPQIGQVIARIIKDIHDCGWGFRHLQLPNKDAMVLDLDRLARATWSA